tara:strand:- start:1214 stop:3643 length:2430 start_codon:yes stop_codon:yes gene_type:complete
MQEGSQILKSFQLTTDGIKKKSDDTYGLSLAKYIVSTVNSGVGSYYFNRNARFRQNRNASNGRIRMQKFMDLLELNGKQNYVNINWQSIRIVNRIVSGLVGRWMSRGEKIDVTATDPISVKQKIADYKEMEFLMKHKALVENLEQQAGVQLKPDNVKIASDKEELDLWVSEFQRLPEEIKYEMGCNQALDSNGWFDVLKEKVLRDSAEVGLVGTHTWMDENGVIHIDWIKPENIFYSYSEHNDFRDTTWRGQVRAMKISELRKTYGEEFGGKLSEKRLWEIAGTSKEFQFQDKISWIDQWTSTYARPYDEWNVDVFDFEVKTVDSEPYTVITTKKNKSTLIKKGAPIKKDDNESIIEDTKWNIYRGVFIKDQDFMLEWGIKTNMIRPLDPREIGNADFSYSFYMYQNYEMRNIAVPEKIEEPADQMILARLKMQQLVAKMRPTGAKYNIDALQEIDLGLATGVSSPTEIQRIYDQTGNLYFRGRDAEGNQIPVPMEELANNGFLGQMQGLISLYQFHYQVLKDELGEDPNLIAQALQPRVTSGNVDTAQDAANNATGYMYDAYRWLMADTAKKVCCLLKDSVTYGSKVYREILKEEDVDKRIFSTSVKMLPDDQEIAKFEGLMGQAMAGNPQLVLYVDPFQLMRIAKQDAKLAETLFRQGQKKMLLSQQEQAAQQSQMNAQVQAESAKAAEEEKRATMTIEVQTKGEIESMLSKERQKETILAGIFGIYQRGLAIPTELKSLETEMINNVALPLFQNSANEQSGMQQQQQPAQQDMQQQEQGGQDMGGQEAPPESDQAQQQMMPQEQQM